VTFGWIKTGIKSYKPLFYPQTPYRPARRKFWLRFVASLEATNRKNIFAPGVRVRIIYNHDYEYEHSTTSPGAANGFF
jgi:hypothetical protein